MLFSRTQLVSVPGRRAPASFRILLLRQLATYRWLLLLLTGFSMFPFCLSSVEFQYNPTTEGGKRYVVLHSGCVVPAPFRTLIFLAGAHSGSLGILHAYQMEFFYHDLYVNAGKSLPTA